MSERRQGKTRVWEMVIVTGEGKILATSEWGTNYELDKACWEALPVLRPEATQETEHG